MVERPPNFAAEQVAAPPSVGANGRVLCVDLDGSLVRTDTFSECILGGVRTRPLQAIRTLLAMPTSGRAHTKRRFAELFDLNVDTLPYSSSLIEHIRKEKERGQQVVLVTGADSTIAQRVAARVRLFDQVIASNGLQNITGSAKLDVLRESFGDDGFEYIGDSVADLPIWRACGLAKVANPSIWVGLLLWLAKIPSVAVCQDHINSPRACLRALRPYQWFKNILLFVPAFFAHELLNRHVFLVTLLATVSFSLVASAIYVVNDLLDLEGDRNHELKKRRPLASGQVSFVTAIWLTLLCLVTGLLLATVVSVNFLLVLLGYAAIAAAYSLYLKTKMLVDVFILSGFYGIRILAGGIATNIIISPWLIAFSLFGFLSLALCKRYSELARMQQGRPKSARRGYRVTDMDQLALLGTSSGFISALVVALYINTPDVGSRYRHPEMLWLLCPLLLYWFSRVWLLTRRGDVNEDPILFAFRDRVSYAVVLVSLAVFALAL
jgi:4-hydroxybenzoate polyprenyltransferase/phosphoserine phosphatase